MTQQKEPLCAGSGLVATTRSLWVVADDLNHLVQLGREDLLNGKGFAIFSGELPEEFSARKRVKPDTECIFQLPSLYRGTVMLAFPSGSKPQRNRASIIQIDEFDQFVGSREIYVSSFIEFLDKRIPDLNIEGGALLEDEVVLLQRGNGKAGFNGVISFSVEILKSILQSTFDADSFNPTISEVALPSLNGVPLTFTDACTHRDAIYFSAAAEGGGSTYEDGEIIASVIGKLRPEVDFLLEIEKIKIEGLAAAEGVSELTLFAVTDADHPSQPSQLLKLGSSGEGR